MIDIIEVFQRWKGGKKVKKELDKLLSSAHTVWVVNKGGKMTKYQLKLFVAGDTPCVAEVFPQGANHQTLYKIDSTYSYIGVSEKDERFSSCLIPFDNLGRLEKDLIEPIQNLANKFNELWEKAPKGYKHRSILK